MGQMGQVCLASLSFVGAHSVSRISTEWGVLVQWTYVKSLDEFFNIIITLVTTIFN